MLLLRSDSATRLFERLLSSRPFTIVCLIAVIGVGALRIISTYKVFNHTNDEPAHIAAGLEWLDRGSYTVELQHPPLARVTVALGPYLDGFRYHGDGFQERLRVLYDHDHYWRLLTLARLGILAFFILATWIVWYWARILYGNAPALLAALIFTNLPPVLAHSGLATTDIPLTATLSGALLAFCQWIERGTLARSLILGLATGLALLSKFSAGLFLVASVLAILAWRSLIARHDAQVSLFGSRRRITHLGVSALTALLVIWAGYQLSYRPLVTKGGPHVTIDRYFASSETLKHLAYFVIENVSIPAPEMVFGINEVRRHNEEGHPGYLLGQYSNYGWWYFFPVALAVKSPLPFLALTATGFVLLILAAKRQKDWRRLSPAIAAAAIFLVCLPSNINIGVRHILPIYPLLTIVAGYGAAQLWNLSRGRLRGPATTLGLLFWLIASPAYSHPDYIAYFNELGGTHPEKLLIDSDLDWGQDLQRLADTLHTHNVETVALAFYGNADLTRHGLPTIRPLLPYQPTKGWIAISEMRLKSVHSNAAHDEFAWLENYQPVALAGRSIKVYYLPEK